MTEIPRDRYSRPLIIPLGDDGKPDLNAKLVPYTRVSTMAKSLDDTSNLMNWKQSVAAIGLAKRPDLMLRVQGIIANYDRPLKDKDAKRAMRSLNEEIADAGGGNTASSAGTALHELTEAMDRGRLSPVGLPAEITRRLDQYREAMFPYEVLGIEVFVINDHVKAAGTFDRLLLCPDGRARVGDLKTGSSDADYPLGVTTQISTYANGSLYDPETGVRTPLADNLDPSKGILIHMPQDGDGCHLYDLDLDLGWRAALTSKEVHEIRKWKARDLLATASV